eukprot:714594-Pyramimonas_sp.AAC.1
MSTLDGAGSNPRTERAVVREANELGAGWISFLQPCEIHRAAGSHKKAYSIVEDLISGQIAWA